MRRTPLELIKNNSNVIMGDISGTDKIGVDVMLY
jgi:hypothetical protein